MGVIDTGGRAGHRIARARLRTTRRTGDRGATTPLRLLGLAAVGLVAIGLAGGIFTALDPVRADSGPAQLLVASMLAPSLLSADVRIKDRSGEDVTGKLGAFLDASFVAESLGKSPCGALPWANGAYGVGAALSDVRAHLPTKAYEAVAAGIAQWQDGQAATAYGRILADLPAELADSLHCRVLHDISADRLSRARDQWNALKPRLLRDGS